MRSAAETAPPSAEQKTQPSLRLVQGGGEVAVASSIIVVNEWAETHPYSSPTPAEIPMDPDYFPDYGKAM